MTAALVLFCWTCCIAAAWLSHYLKYRFPNAELPGFTALMTGWPFWLLLFPLPWFAWALLLSRTRDLSVTTAMQFAGAVSLAVAVLFHLVLVAALLPFQVPYDLVE